VPWGPWAPSHPPRTRHEVAQGIPHFFDDYDYGDGSGYGPGHCDGNHDFGCWRNDLVEVLPRMLAVLQHP
jgi:hypothetical protein